MSETETETCPTPISNHRNLSCLETHRKPSCIGTHRNPSRLETLRRRWGSGFRIHRDFSCIERVLGTHPHARPLSRREKGESPRRQESN